jgi:hypothetical protein
MKTKLLLILSVFPLLWMGCIEVQSKENGVYYCAGCKTQRHEGCEYVIYKFGASEVSITHKGNCDNLIHK